MRGVWTGIRFHSLQAVRLYFSPLLAVIRDFSRTMKAVDHKSSGGKMTGNSSANG